MSSEDHNSKPETTKRIEEPRSGRLDKALARTSDAPLRADNHLELLKDGSQTFDDWLGYRAGGALDTPGKLHLRGG